jgi:APA family basic amino acid/polyamine antiporter
MSITITPADDEKLVRALGVRQVTASIVNCTVGAGIFLFPALLSRELGAAAPLAFVICGAAMALIVSAFAIAGSRVSITGGIFAYVETAFGPFVGFLSGVLQWLTFILAVSSVSSALLDQLSVFMPVLGGLLWQLLLLALILGGLAFINVRGVRAAARTIEVMTAAKLVPLLLFVTVGAFAVQPSNIAWPGMPDGDAIGRAVLMLIFAFMGIEVALAPSGEVRDPARTVPRAIFLALAITASLYIAIQLVAQGVLGAALAEQSRAPLAEAASRFMGEAGRTMLLIGAMCSMFGYVSGDMLSSPRNLFAFARAGVLPAAFARVHPTRRTPHIAIWTHAALVFALASTNSFERLLIVSNVAGLGLYFMGCAAAIELTRRNVQGAGVPLAIPGTHVVPILAAVVILWIMSSATVPELTITAGTLAVASLLYLFRRR